MPLEAHYYYLILEVRRQYSVLIVQLSNSPDSKQFENEFNILVQIQKDLRDHERDLIMLRYDCLEIVSQVPIFSTIQDIEYYIIFWQC